MGCAWRAGLPGWAPGGFTSCRASSRKGGGLHVVVHFGGRAPVGCPGHHSSRSRGREPPQPPHRPCCPLPPPPQQHRPTENWYSNHSSRSPVREPPQPPHRPCCQSPPPPPPRSSVPWVPPAGSDDREIPKPPEQPRRWSQSKPPLRAHGHQHYSSQFPQLLPEPPKPIIRRPPQKQKWQRQNPRKTLG